ncbi:hypothetical protein GCM10023186_25090 [Hymenobacter koreensis]|uniref:Uncharacterized protein n=1 Tax=Hymenobacter koreensis TaxID=1084523 RepID=A0ABP8J280_9BACT
MYRSFLLLLWWMVVLCVQRAHAQSDTATAKPATQVNAAITSPVAVAEAIEPLPPVVTSSSPDSPAVSLRGLSVAQRQQQGRADAKQHYRPAKGVFWTGAALGFVTPPLFISGQAGLAAGATGCAVVLGVVPPRAPQLLAQVPRPELLQDPDYRSGYEHQSNRKKRGRALLGWGVGSAVSLGVSVAILAALFPNGIGFGG